MLLGPDSRESGCEFAAGCFLIALGIGLLIPRPGTGLYSLLHSDGYAWAWSTALLTCGGGLMAASHLRQPVLRLVIVILAMFCWIALAARFGEAQLWGAMIQSLMGVFLMNACAFRLIHYIKDR
jgi:hypothetical protein